MKNRAIVAAIVMLAVVATGPAARSAAPQDTVDRVRLLLTKLEDAGSNGSASAFLDLLSSSADRSRAGDFVESELRSGITKVVIQERVREALPDTPEGEGYRLLVDAFLESGARARISTWQLDVRKEDNEWRIVDEGRVSSVENVYRLSVNRTKQFAAQNLTISSEDLVLTIAEGSVFTVDTDQGVTGLVVIGRGDMRFRPTPDTEKGQVKIFAGSETLESRFDAAFIRVGTLDAHLDRSRLVERPVDSGDLKRAEQVFREESSKSYALDLADLTRDTWSMLLDPSDFVAEVRTRRFDTITYARSSSEPEDIAVFDRRRQRNIAVYPSEQKLAARGRFYNEDDFAAYDVLDYDIDVTYSPDRQWINGRVTMRLKIRSGIAGQFTIRLSDSLVVQSIVSNRYGRLFSLRSRGQNAVLVNLPILLMRDEEVALTVTYYGRVQPEAPDRETIALGSMQDSQDEGGPSLLDNDPLIPRPEPSFLYSNRSYWYPQALTSDYATATIRLTVPTAFDCVASGQQAANSPILIPASDTLPAVKTFIFAATRPVRYLSFLVTRLIPVEPVLIPSVNLSVQANPRRGTEGREAAVRLADIEEFYQSIVGESPYQGLALAVVEGTVPGGHSRLYFVMLSEPLPGIPIIWSNDPAAFKGYPEFFLAHETAHQWWGQAVGWCNYHEQWLSEGFAQYFAALYGQRRHGDQGFATIMRQMRKWSLDESNEGPVYLGYRLGHIRKDGKVFRALVYNKGAVVLHMLRRLIGDDAFFRGIRRFYTESRFTKASTEDFRRAMESESDRSLERFFERWIYGSTLPQLSFTYRIDAAAGRQELVLHFEQAGDELFDIPVTVTIRYADKRSVDVVVPVTDRTADMRVPLTGVLRTVEISKDDGTLADVQRGS